jgi:hypothetical protein
MTSAVAALAGAAICVLLVRLDPGPGPKRLASPDAWARHESRVRKMRGPFAVISSIAIGLVTLLTGPAVDRALAAGVGFIAALVVMALLRVMRTR